MPRDTMLPVDQMWPRPYGVDWSATAAAAAALSPPAGAAAVASGAAGAAAASGAGAAGAAEASGAAGAGRRAPRHCSGQKPEQLRPGRS